MDWRSVVSASPPAGFQAGDPASPAYHFGALDAVVEAVARAGLEPMLVVSHAPAFAEAPGRWQYAYAGSWAPEPSALEAFAAALARRYDGVFADPLHSGASLPRVSVLQAWNEPNLARYLEPQWVVSEGRWSAFSPLLYRQLLDAFYAGVKSAMPNDQVVSAGLAPAGEPAGEGRMSPIVFLEALLCLRDRPGACPEAADFDALAIHPLSVASPDAGAALASGVAIADLAKVTGLLRRAERLHTVAPAGRKPVWVTELNWESSPPAPAGVPGRLQARWISRALHRLWVAGVSLVDWQFLIDPYPGLTAATPTGETQQYSRPAGLYSAGAGGKPALATPKPFLQGFEVPFDPLRVNRSLVRVWALLARPREAALLQRLAHGRWRTLARLRASRSAVVNALVRLRGRALVRLYGPALTSAPSPLPALAAPPGAL